MASDVMYFGGDYTAKVQAVYDIGKSYTIKLCYDLCIGNLLRIERKHDVFLVYTVRGTNDWQVSMPSSFKSAC